MAVDDAVARLEGSFETDVVEEGSETTAAGTVLRQAPDPGTRAVFGSTATLIVARATEWATTWSQNGSGSYDSGPIEATAVQGKWRIVLELRPRYLFFGSGSAGVSWEGTGAGQIGLDEVGSGEVSPLSGAGSWAQLGIHAKSIGLVNASGYFDDLLSFVDGAAAEGFVSGANRRLVTVRVDAPSLLDAVAL